MKEFKVGIQLYSLREEMAKDMDATLKAVKEMGYDYVEFAGYFDKPVEEIKAILDKYDLKAISVHRGVDFFEADPETEIGYLKGFGAKYSAIPWYSVDEYFNNWDATVESFTKLGKLLKENGIQLMYHNHDFEFKTIDGEVILDKLYATIPEDLLMPEFDTCWIHYAGNDPAEYLKKYAGRIDVVHLKDFVCNKLGGGPVYALIGKDDEGTKEDNGFRFRPVGEGIQDWNAILEACEECGAEYVIVEQDEWYDESALDCAARSRKYLRETFGF